MRSRGVPDYPDLVPETNPKLPQVAQYKSTVDRLAAAPAYQLALTPCHNAANGTTGDGVG